MTYRKYSLVEGKTLQAERAQRLLQPMTIRCYCGRVFDGGAGDVIDRVAAHRQSRHPGRVRAAESQKKLLRKHKGKVNHG